VENEKKDERAKQVKMNLEAAKEFKAVEEMRQLCMKKDQHIVKNMEMDSILKGKQSELDVMSDKLLGLMTQISKASESLSDYRKQSKSKKLLVRYYSNKDVEDSPKKTTELDTLCNFIEKAFSCVKGRHASTKA
jgi:hypothetical protein